jgi:membrane-associated phospholipid phosphatase
MVVFVRGSVMRWLSATLVLVSVGLAIPASAGAGSTRAAAAGTEAGSASVTGWIDVALKEISGHRVNPPRASRALALVSVAIERGSAYGRPAVHGAAAEVLGYLFPDRAASFEQRAGKLGRSAAQLRRGRAIGAQVVERARRDNSDAAYDGIRLFGIGFWTEPPGVAGPLEPAAGQWLPWNLASGSAYRPPPPPAPHDPEYTEQVMEVYETSLNLTPEQRRIALFWADGAGTETPPGHWNRIAIELVEDAHLSYTKAARTFALLNTAQADAFIAAWDAKFVYWCERPDQAIRRMVDPNWSPFIGTPPFPGYVSGHSTTSGAASTVLGAIFPRRSRDLASMADEAAISRLYGGIHFSFDNDAGLVLGRRIGQAALAR